MKLMDRLLGRGSPSSNGSGPSETKIVGSGVTWVGSPDTRRIIHLDGVPYDAEMLTRGTAYAASAYAYSAINWRAQRIAEPPLQVVRDDDEGGVDVIAHRLDDMLAEPSLDFDMGELQEITESYRLRTGACLWVRSPDSAGRDAQWMPFSADEFTSESADGRIFGRFRVETSKGKREFSADEVVFFRETAPGDWRNPVSKLDVALAQLDLGHQIQRTVRGFMAKAMFPGGVISTHQDWNPSNDEWEAYKTELEAWYQGAANAGNPLIATGGTTFSSTAFPLKDLLPTAILDRVEATAASVFGVPPVVLGWLVGLENSPWSQMGEARQMTYEETIQPRWADIARAMTRQLLTPDERAAGLRIDFDITDIRAFSADDAVRAEVVAKSRREWTVNERRVYMGLPALDDERGDQIDGESSGAPNPFATDDEPDDEPVPDVEEDEMVEVAKAAYEAEHKSDPRAFEWLVFDFSTKAGEQSFADAVEGALTEQATAIDRIAARALEAKAIDGDSVTAFLGEVTKYLRDEGYTVMYRATLPRVRSTAESAVKRVASAVGLPFAILQEGLLDYAAEEAGFVASVMGETTGAKVVAAVEKSLNAGGVIADLRKELQDSAAFTRDRAQLTARTETTRAWNGAQRRQMSKWEREQPEGTTVMKTWLSSRDDRVRPEHEDLDGESVAIGATFSNGLEQPSEPNCRCTLTYAIEGI